MRYPGSSRATTARRWIRPPARVSRGEAGRRRRRPAGGRPAGLRPARLRARRLALRPRARRRARERRGDGRPRAPAAHAGRALGDSRSAASGTRRSPTCEDALAEHADADGAHPATLIRLGRTDEAISAAEWAVAGSLLRRAVALPARQRLRAQELHAARRAYPAAFADAAGRKRLGAADGRLAAGRRDDARRPTPRIVPSNPGWADVRVRLASLDFEDGRFAVARDGCFAALAICPEYGRAHAVLAKALESQRFEVDVHRPAYEAPLRGGAACRACRGSSVRRQLEVAVAAAPEARGAVDRAVATRSSRCWWRAAPPSTSSRSTCGSRSARTSRRCATRASTTTRGLWDDVRGCGGYHTVTGIEDVERTIFDRYNTVLHELTHQVHGVMPADDAREIQEHYRRAKERDDETHDAYLSRYAGGSVYEYFAEGANALESRDARRLRPARRGARAAGAHGSGPPEAGRSATSRAPT